MDDDVINVSHGKSRWELIKGHLDQSTVGTGGIG